MRLRLRTALALPARLRPHVTQARPRYPAQTIDRPATGVSRRPPPRRRRGLVGLLLLLSIAAERLGRVVGRRARDRTAQPEPERRSASRRVVQIIEPRRPGTFVRLSEVWRYRRLVRYFSRKYIEKRYIRTWLGWLWLPLRPILSVGSRVLLFGALLAVPSEGKPYLLFYLVGFSAWTLFAETTYWATRSIELNRSILKRMYVPRLTVLVAAPANGIVNYLLYLAITCVVVAYYAAVSGVFHLELALDSVLLVAAGLALMVLVGLCVGLFTSVWGARARDIRFSLGYVLNLWLFITPVIYPLSAVPDSLRTVVLLNPMTAPVEMVRKGLLGTGGAPTTSLAVTLGTVAVLLIAGLWFFGREEAAALDSL